MITEQTLSRLQEDGYYFPIDILSPTEVAQNRKSFEQLLDALGGRPGPEKLKQTHLYHEWAYRLVTDSRILDVIESILGPNLLVHSTSIFCKYPHDDGFIPWHQDGVYWGLNKSDLWSVWLALSDSTIENGCMRVIPGTHKQKLGHFEQVNDKVLLGSGLTMRGDLPKGDIINLELKAGQISLHHLHIAHSSEPNRSNGPRIGFAMRFVDTQIKQTLPHFDVVLARGKDEYGHYSLLKSPPTKDLATSLKQQEQCTNKYEKIRADFLASN